MAICSFFAGTNYTVNKISEDEALKIAEEHFRINYKETFLNSTSVVIDDVYVVSRFLDNVIDSATTVFIDKDTYDIINVVD